MSPQETAVKNEEETDRDPARAAKHFKAGREAEAKGNRWKAIESYEHAFEADPEDAEICFRLAYLLDLAGEEDEALHLYEQCVRRPEAPLNGLLNLAVLYEDLGRYEEAEKCVRQVLATEPNHPRARLFLKDILASTDMVIDDEKARHLEHHHALVETPLTDFDFEPATRGALNRLEMGTLGDLLRITETELRNHDVEEESIDEIRRLLAQRGLRLGQAIQQQQQQARDALYEQISEESGAEKELLGKGVEALGLSVRAQKALSLLNVQTIGDLCSRSRDELLGIKNFGQTSLNEITERLEENGLSLREE